MEGAQLAWVQDIRDGDRQAFRAMFYAYYSDLSRFALRCGYDGHDASDVVQDVFLAIWENRQNWDVHTSLKAYLYRAVRNRVINANQRSTRRRQMKDRFKHSRNGVQRQTATDRIQLEDLSLAIQRAIDELPERRRMVFVLHRHHDLTYAEIAEIMDISRKTVENQMGRALKFLREQVNVKKKVRF